MKAAPLALALLIALVSCENRVPFTGDHQAGITTPPQKFAFVAAFDVTATSADEVRELFKTWSRAAEALTQGLPLGTDTTLSAPASDTGEVTGYKPARLTLTFGVGPSLFDGRFGLEPRRPAALKPLPVFQGDQLRPDWSDGDLVVQVGADDYQTAYHALHTLTRAAKGRAVARWVQDGFQPGLEVNPKGPARNLEGFIDGTNNPDTTKPEVMDQVVWADRGSDWMAGGSYLVVRRIRMLVEVWDRSSLGDQQTTIGRDRFHGKELDKQDPDSHVLTVRGAGVEKILRRPFHYVNGLDGRTGQWDSGLLFLAWMKDPARQFVPMQTRMSSFDLLNEYIQPVGSAVFAVFPGVEKGSYVGAGLFPEAPLASRIEALLGAVGSVYPAVAARDWTAVRNGAGAWNSLWKKETDGSERSRTIEALRDAWVASLTPDAPDANEVRTAQSALVKALVAWEKEEAPKNLGSATDLQGLKDRLSDASKAVEAGNGAAARTAFLAFNKEWVSKEALVRSLDASAYGTIEVGMASARLALNAEKPGAAAREALKTLSDRLGGLRSPTAFGALDAGFLMFREGLEALLVLAALLTFLARSEQKKLTPWVWTGAGSGIAASILVAIGITVLMTGWTAAAAPALVEGLTGMAAVILMLSVGIWLHGKSAVKNWNVWMKGQMGKVGDSPWALAALAFLAVLREGAETVVFFWGLAGSMSTTDLLLGIGGAFVVLAVLGTLMIGFSKRLPLQWFFPLATGLIYFLAVKMLGQSLSSLQAAGWIPTSPLGFGAPVDFFGFTPTWQSAAPQVVLFLILGTLVVLPLLKGQKKPVPAPKPAT